MGSSRIVAIEWGTLEGKRPRLVGSNARLGPHGDTIRLPLVRLTTEDGQSGVGLCITNEEKASALLGRSFDDVFDLKQGTAIPWLAFDYALWDLAGKRKQKPVY